MPSNENVVLTSSSYHFPSVSLPCLLYPKLLHCLNHQPHQWQNQQEQLIQDENGSKQKMNKKNNQILEISDEEDEENKEEQKDINSNKEDDSNVNKIKKEVKNIDGFLAGSGNCRSWFLPMLSWKKELGMLSRLSKNFGMKDVKAVVNTYSNDGNKA